MSKEQYIRDLRVLGPDERFRSVFLVQAKDLRRNKKTGDPFLSLQLGDCTGTLDARMWDVREGVTDQFRVNDFIDVHGRIQVYRERPQIIVHKLSVVPEGQVTLSDFMPHTKHDVEAMYAKVLSLIDSFRDQHLKRLLKSIFGSPDIAKAYKKAPAAKSMHHARLGGLLEHVSSVLNLAVAVSANYEDVDRDLLISGVLLHDLGKIYELKSDRTFEYSDAGLLLGHIPIGSAWLGRCCDEIKGFPPRLKMVLLHMILSHHGKREFGSPQLPAFPEALALHFIDDLDSKLEMMRTATAELTDGEVWSRFPKGLDGPVLDKAAFLQEASTRPAPATSPRSEPRPSSPHLSPAPDLPTATPTATPAITVNHPPEAAVAGFQPPHLASPTEVGSEAESESEGASESHGGAPRRELPPPNAGEPSLENEARAAEQSSKPESPGESEASHRSAIPLIADLSSTASDTGRDQDPDVASASVESTVPEQAEAPPDSPAPHDTSAKAPAIDAVASSDGQSGGQLADSTEPTGLPAPDANPRDDPTSQTDLESAATTNTSEWPTSIDSGPPELPPALPPLESVALAVSGPGPNGPEISDQSESEQPEEKRAAKAPVIKSREEPKPALRPEPVDRPTIVSSPSGVSAPPAAPPLPNPPPDSQSADNNEGALQGALFELDEPSAEYPG